MFPCKLLSPVTGESQMIPYRIAFIIKDVIKRITWCIENSKILSDFSVLCMYLPRNMGDGNIRLRPFRFRDRHVIEDGLRYEDIFSPRAMTDLILKSYLSVWWWLRRTYAVLYCIEADSVCIGFIGLYNLQLTGRLNCLL